MSWLLEESVQKIRTLNLWLEADLKPTGPQAGPQDGHTIARTAPLPRDEQQLEMIL